MIPAIGGECFFGFDADGVVDPDAGEIHVDFAVIHVEAEAFAVGIVDHLGDDASVRRAGGLDAGGNGEWVVDVQRRVDAGVDGWVEGGRLLRGQCLA